MSPPPSPFPASPAAAAAALQGIGPIGAWAGDDIEGVTETAAAQVQPSILSQIRAIELRPRCEACHGVLLRDGDLVWCPTCESGVTHLTDEQTETLRQSAPSIRDLAHQPAAGDISEAVAYQHDLNVARMVLGKGAEVQLTYNQDLRVYELIGSPSVMDALMSLGFEFKVKISL